MTKTNLIDDKSLIEIIKNSFKKARTRQGLVFITIYVLAFIFAIVALIITVYTLQNFGGSEMMESTRKIFRDFGYPLGSLIISLQYFSAILVIPFLANLCISVFEGKSYYSYISLIGFSFIEAYAFLQLTSSFLDMFNDIIAFHILSNRGNYVNWIDFLLNPEKIYSISIQIFIVTLITIFAIRVILYFGKNKF